MICHRHLDFLWRQTTIRTGLKCNILQACITHIITLLYYSTRMAEILSRKNPKEVKGYLGLLYICIKTHGFFYQTSVIKLLQCCITKLIEPIIKLNSYLSALTPTEIHQNDLLKLITCSNRNYFILKEKNV